ncbi:integrase catalytic domain-containing protein, partial [Trichonephila inaurata madagascariensis]
MGWILRFINNSRTTVEKRKHFELSSHEIKSAEKKRIRYRRKLIEDFRSRFRKEYLGQLRQKLPGKVGNDFKIGDIVIIEELSKKRVFWPLGKVIGLLPGRDGKVRTLKIR